LCVKPKSTLCSLRADARKLCLHLHLRISRILAERFYFTGRIFLLSKKAGHRSSESPLSFHSSSCFTLTGNCSSASPLPPPGLSAPD
jgi:hypothetical protein